MKTDNKPRLPYGQLAVLSLCRIAEPVALTSIFPYIPEMIESFGIAKNDVGKWAGTTSAAFSFAQSLTGVLWGTASDVFGRKATILVGLSFIMIATVLFGFSQTLTWAITARAIAGASSGIVGITRTIIAELVPEKELQPMAFSAMPLMWSMGSILGPIFGGALAKPAERYPDLFGNNEFLLHFPFALPNLIAGGIFLAGVCIGTLFLKETLETRKYATDYGRVVGKILTRPFTGQGRTRKSMEDRENKLDQSQPPRKAKKTPKPVKYRDVFNQQSSLNLLSYTILAFHSIAFDNLIPVLLHMSPQTDADSRQLPFKFTGGFGMNSGQIGVIFTAYAIVGMLCQFLVYPPFARRFGILRCYRATTALAPLSYFIMPYTVLLPSSLHRTAIVFVMSVKCIVGVFAFPCSMIMITNSVSSLRLLGTLNGMSTSISAVGRGSGPAITGWAFTVGVDSGYMIFPWWLLSVVALAGHIVTWFLLELDLPVADDDDEDDVDEVVAAQDEGQEHQPLLGTHRAHETSAQYNTISQRED